MEKLDRVAIVVDPAFGAKLFELSERMHVWVCATPDNLKAIKTVGPGDDQKYFLASGITSFTVKANGTPEEMFLRVIDDVEQHHGKYSYTTPWAVLEIYGVDATEAIKAKLAQFGVGSYEKKSSGFIFDRTVKKAKE